MFILMLFLIVRFYLEETGEKWEEKGRRTAQKNELKECRDRKQTGLGRRGAMEITRRRSQERRRQKGRIKKRKESRCLVYPASHGKKHNEGTALFSVCVYVCTFMCTSITACVIGLLKRPHTQTRTNHKHTIHRSCLLFRLILFLRLLYFPHSKWEQGKQEEVEEDGGGGRKKKECETLCSWAWR